MRFLILAHAGDQIAAAVADALVARHGEAEVKLVSGEALALAPGWWHRLGRGQDLDWGQAPPPHPARAEWEPVAARDAAAVSSKIHLADGTVLTHGGIGVVFNRLHSVVLPHFAKATPEDHNYAVMETYALWLSWLAGLSCPLINPVTPRGLAWPGRSPVEWLYLAGQAGLPVRQFLFSSDPRAFRRDDFAAFPAVEETGPGGGEPHPMTLPQVNRRPTYFLEPLADGDATTVLVAGDRSVGFLAESFAGGLRNLATLSGCELLQVNFGHAAAGLWRVQAISAFPVTLAPYWLEAIVGLLETRSQG